MAIQEYGRLQKTLFLLRYAESEDLRRRIGRQLNKGGDLHALRRFLFFADDGNMRRRDPEEQGDQALCSNLLADTVVTWNTSTTKGSSNSSPGRATRSATRTRPTFGRRAAAPISIPTASTL